MDSLDPFVGNRREKFPTHRCDFAGLRGLQRGFQEAWVSLQLS